MSRPRKRARGAAFLHGILEAWRGCTQGGAGTTDCEVNPWGAQAFRWDTSWGPFSPPSPAGGSQFPAEADRVPGALIHVSDVCGDLGWAGCDRGVLP